MKHNLALYVVTAIAALSLAGQAFAMGWGHGGGCGHGDDGWGWGGAPFGPGAVTVDTLPSYADPPVIVQQPATEMYAQPAPQPAEQSYWYYCQNPQGYYPYVKQCPSGWMKVVPSPSRQ